MVRFKLAPKSCIIFKNIFKNNAIKKIFKNIFKKVNFLNVQRYYFHQFNNQTKTSKQKEKPI